MRPSKSPLSLSFNSGITSSAIKDRVINGAWSSPVNLGPDVNSAADEFRPRLWIHNDFTNDLLMFSSDRDGGKGGFDLYFIGYTFPENR